ncbi:MAG: hypothetical protein WB689_39660, partial [Xanthobacteraceae bacterium]
MDDLLSVIIDQCISRLLYTIVLKSIGWVQSIRIRRFGSETCSRLPHELVIRVLRRDHELLQGGQQIVPRRIN